MAMHPSPRSSTPAHSTLTHALPHTMHLTAARPLNTYLRIYKVNPHGTLMKLFPPIINQTTLIVEKMLGLVEDSERRFLESVTIFLLIIVVS